MHEVLTAFNIKILIWQLGWNYGVPVLFNGTLHYCYHYFMINTEAWRSWKSYPMTWMKHYLIIWKELVKKWKKNDTTCLTYGLLPQWQCRWKWWWDVPYQRGYVVRKAAGSYSAGTGTELCRAIEPWSRNRAHLKNRQQTHKYTEHCRFKFQTNIFRVRGTQCNLKAL